MREGIKNPKLMAAVRWLLAIFVLGLAVYFMPFLIIGFIAGIYVGKNYDMILEWLDDLRGALDDVLEDKENDNGHD